MGRVTDSAPRRTPAAPPAPESALPAVAAPGQPRANRAPARLARETTPENPWPLRLLSTKIDEYVNKMTFVWVEGQIVQFNRRPGSGMQYLTLRDTDADMSMSVSVFTRELAAIERATGTQVTEGARVVVHAKPRFWTKRGSLELRADDIRPVGIGDLLARIEQLRRILAAEGLFDAERKRPLPFLPRKVGLVCGRNAKAKDDVVVNARLRWAGLPFEIREVAVQGAQAVREVTAAVRELDANPEVDVIVVARGGGAVEDLLPFSDEGLVRAAAAARTPIVSAIGHETDYPLLDLVADYRASTPTDAARRIVPDLAEEMMGLDQARERMRTVLRSRLDAEQRGLDQVLARPVMADPTLIVRDRVVELSQARERMRRALSATLSLATADLRADHARLRALSPQGVLDRGYAILRNPGGGIITSAQQLKKGDLIEGVLGSGRLVAQVVGTTKPEAAR
ncbi:exodeoxyribonuclease VII large subunit [Actinomyces sp.]|uniref:exodeoxyribonuclease VII large subunit n=1 Tax=Actinomyces sp. TaxID=29317 RepID=UPI0026DD222E|nr:exodeoxyribonuclease VII large subunit [Actinomyces sp.]MDO4900637.1 exodeoxyribonuclease VII large subunit [Actinomyces sp.]